MLLAGLGDKHPLLTHTLPEGPLGNRQGRLLPLSKALHDVKGGFWFEVESCIVHPADAGAKRLPLFPGIGSGPYSLLPPSPGL